MVMKTQLVKMVTMMKKLNKVFVLREKKQTETCGIFQEQQWEEETMAVETT